MIFGFGEADCGKAPRSGSRKSGCCIFNHDTVFGAKTEHVGRQQEYFRVRF